MSSVRTKKVDDFEKLLKLQDERSNNLLEELNQADKTVKESGTVAERLRANCGATLDDFIEMVGKLVSKGMKADNAEFLPDEGARLSVDATKKIDHPYITYDIVSSSPADGEIKPRIREEILESTDDKPTQRIGDMWGQRRMCVVQFNILAPDYKQANKTLKDFEELMFTYTSYLKQKGVQEIIFRERLTDKNWDIYRQSLSVRNIMYNVRVEKLFPMFDSVIADVFVNQ